MGAPKGSLALDGPRALAAAALTYATLLMWLGLLHLNTLAVIAALACLPHPAAAATLALLAAACVLPVDRPFAPWQKRLARHISDTAHAYFPISMHCEDSATFDGTEKFVIGAPALLRLRLRGCSPRCAPQGLSRTACCRSPPSRFTTARRFCPRRLRRGRAPAWPAPSSSACRW